MRARTLARASRFGNARAPRHSTIATLRDSAQPRRVMDVQSLDAARAAGPSDAGLGWVMNA